MKNFSIMLIDLMFQRKLSALFLLACACAFVANAEWQAVSYPLAIKVEGETMATSISLSVMENVETVPALQCREAAVNSREYAVVKIVDSLLAGDKNSYRSWNRQDPTSKTGGEMAEGEAKEFAFQKSMFGSGDVKQIQKFFGLGRTVLSIVDMSGARDAEGGRVPLLIQPTESAYQNAFHLMTNPVVESLVATLRAQDSNPGLFQKRAVPTSDSSVRIDTLLGEMGGEHEVKVQFHGAIIPGGETIFRDGEYVQGSDSLEQAELVNVRSAYRQVWECFSKIPEDDEFLKSPEMADYLGFYSTKSAGKVQRMLEKLNPEDFKDYKRLHSMERSIYYIIDASPLYFVFYAQNPGEGINRLQQDTLLESKGKFSIANVGFEGSIERLLKSEPIQQYIISQLQLK